MRILVVNAGSQTVKLRVVDDADQITASTDLGPPDGQLASQLADFLRRSGPVDLAGHRVVHGGSRFTSPVVIDSAVRQELKALNDLAPLHNPPALAGIDAVRQLLPDVPSVACFDTAFHADLPPESAAYALPADWVSRWGIRRYGFHGLSCAWALRRAAQVLERPATALRLIVCHLGGGASVTSIAGGRSVDTSMGFTPLEGLVMATRSGDVDPGILLYLEQQGLSAADVEDGLLHHSGLLGLSRDRSSDMRELLAVRDHDEAAQLAVAVYLHRLRAKIAAAVAASDGTDAIVFTGGVGEHSADVRAETCSHLSWLGVELNQSANEAVGDRDVDVSADGATVRTLVIHARECLEIARQCRSQQPAQR